MVVNAVMSLELSGQVTPRAFDGGYSRRFGLMRGKRSETILLTGLALALAACGGSSSSGGGTPTPQASLSLRTDTDSGVKEDGVTSEASIVLKVTQAPAGAVVEITQGGERVGELLTPAADGADSVVRFDSGVAEGATRTFVVRVLTSATNDKVLGDSLTVTVDREAPQEVGLTTTEFGTAEVPLARDTITQIAGTGEVGARAKVALGDQTLGEATVGEDGTFAVDLDEAARELLAEGENTLVITQTDSAGNVSVESMQKVYVEPVLHPALLTVSNDSGVVGDNITNTETVVFAVSAREGKQVPTDAVVEIMQDGTRVGELLALTADGEGFTVSFVSGVAEGATGTFVVRVLTSATDETVLSGDLTVTVDREAPQAVGLTTTEFGTAEVPLARDTITQIAGTGEAGARVQVMLGDQTLGEATVGEDGTFVVALDEAAQARLAEGENTLVITQTDVTGNRSADLSQTVYVAQDPAAAISLSSDSGVVGDNITNTETVVFAVSAREGKQVPTDAVVEIMQDGTRVGELLALTADGEGFTVSFVSGVAEGATGTFVVRVLTSATDETVLSRDLTVTVDREAPQAVGLTTTEFGTAEVPLARETITQIGGTGEAGARVQVMLGDQTLGEATVGEDGTFVVALDEAAQARLAEGENTLVIAQTDVTGNRSADLSQTVYVGQDPAAVISLSSDSGVVGDNITNTETVVFAVSAREGKQVPTDAVVEIMQDGTRVGELRALTADGEGFTVSFDSGVAEGATGTFVVRVLTSATDETVLSGDLTVTVDREAPQAVGLTTTEFGTAEVPLARDTITQIAGTGEAGARVQVMLGDQTLGEATVGEDGTFVVALDDAAQARLAEGENTLVIAQTDVTGNRSADLSQTVYVAQDPAAAISLSSDSGVVGDNITNTETVVFAVSAREGKQVPTDAVVEIMQDGTRVGELLALTADGEGFTVSFVSGVAEGATGTFVVRVLTSATDETVLSGDLTVTVDREAPQAVGLTTTEFGTAEVPLARDTITQIAGTGEAGARVQVMLGDQTLGEATVGEDGTFVVALDEAAQARLAEGENTLVITQTDVTGNRSADLSQTVYVAQDPAAAISLSSDSGVVGDNITNTETVVFAVSAREGKQVPTDAVVEIMQDGTRVGELLALTADGEGFTVSFVSGVAEGATGTFVVRVLTSATDETVLSRDLTVTVDREAPQAVGLTTTEFGTAEVPLARETITQIGGTGEAGARVQVMLGDQTLGEATVGEDGTFVVALDEAAQARLAEGENTLVIAQTDVTGNRSADLSQTVYVGQDPAAVISLSSDSDSAVKGDNITNRDTIVFAVSAVEGTQLPADAVVEITRSGTRVGELLPLIAGDEGFTVSFVSEIAEGTLGTFVVRVLRSATDETVISTEDLTVTVDRDPPQSLGTTTANLGSPGAPLARDAIPQTITGTGESGGYVLLIGGIPPISQTAEIVEGGTFEVALRDEVRASLVEGANVMRLQYYDVAGNQGESLELIIYVAQDPAVAISLVSDSGTLGDNITNTETILLRVLAEGGAQIPEGAVMEITQDGTRVGELLALTADGGGFTVSFDSGVAEGATGTFVARVLRSATDETVISTQDLTVTVEREAPQAVELTTTEFGTAEVPLAREAITEVAGTGEAGARVQVRLGDQTLGEVTVGEDGTFVVALDEAAQAALVGGENTLVITQTDVAGNQSADLSQTVYVEQISASAVSINLANDLGSDLDDGITNAETILLRVLTEESGAQPPVDAVVEITQDGTRVGELLPLTVDGETFAVSFASEVAEGATGTFVARVLKSATDETVISIRDLTVTVDREPPQPVELTTEFGTAEAPLARDAIPQTITGTGEPGGRVTVSAGATSAIIEFAVIDENGMFELALLDSVRASLVEGANTLTIGIYDLAGNQGADLRPIVYVAPDPVPTIEINLDSSTDSGMNGNNTNVETILLRVLAKGGGQIPADAVMEITRDGIRVGDLLALSPDGESFTASFSSGVVSGATETFVARVLRSATDETVISTEDLTVTVDRERPARVTVTTDFGTEENPVPYESFTEIVGTGEPGIQTILSVTGTTSSGGSFNRTVVSAADGSFRFDVSPELQEILQVPGRTILIHQLDNAYNQGLTAFSNAYLTQPLAEISIKVLPDAGDDSVVPGGGEGLFFEIRIEGGDPDLSNAGVLISRVGSDDTQFIPVTYIETTEGVALYQTDPEGELFVPNVADGETAQFSVVLRSAQTDGTTLSNPPYLFTVDNESPADAQLAADNTLGTAAEPISRDAFVEVRGTAEAGALVEMTLIPQIGEPPQIVSTTVAADGTFTLTVSDEMRAAMIAGQASSLAIGVSDAAGNGSTGVVAQVYIAAEEGSALQVEGIFDNVSHSQDLVESEAYAQVLGVDEFSGNSFYG